MASSCYLLGLTFLKTGGLLAAQNKDKKQDINI